MPARSDRLVHNPYAAFLGVEAGESAGEFAVRWDESLQGRKGFLHGGVIAGLFDMAFHDLMAAIADGAAVHPVDVGVDFLRNGLMETTYIRAHVVRQGRRIVNLQAMAWQSDPARPIATARAHFALIRKA